MSSSILYAGAAQVDITPPLGTLINGDFIAHYAQNIHDPLYAKALLLRCRHTTLLIVAVDICAMRKEFLDDVKCEIHRQTGIRPEDTLICSTHTHAAGSIESLLLVEADLAYRRRLPKEIVAAVIAAGKVAQPAQAGFGSVDVPEHCVCRRFFMKEGYVAKNPVTGGTDRVKTNPFRDVDQVERRSSVPDSEVGFLAVRAVDGGWISVVANYSMHYVGDWENGTISADYFGAFSAGLTHMLGNPQGFVGIMTNGTSGDVNIWDFLQPDRYPSGDFLKSRKIGNDLAEKVFGALADVRWEQTPLLAAWYEEVPVGLRKPSSEELHAARQVISHADYEGITAIDYDALCKIYAREQVLLNEYPERVIFPLQVFRIGNACIGGLGGEFFAETGLWLKRNSPFDRYFTICLANDYVGYVPPAHEIDAGGYETWRCRTSFLADSAEALLRERIYHGFTEVFGLKNNITNE